jgi:hypothetical protein
MSVDCSNHRHVAGPDNRAFRHRRRDAQSLYPANFGPDWVPRTGSGDDWYSGWVAMGTCGRHPIAFWVEFVCGYRNAPSERAELVCGCPRATGATLCSRGTLEALQRQAPIGLTPEPVPGPSAWEPQLTLVAQIGCPSHLSAPAPGRRCWPAPGWNSSSEGIYASPATPNRGRGRRSATRPPYP